MGFQSMPSSEWGFSEYMAPYPSPKAQSRNTVLFVSFEGKVLVWRQGGISPVHYFYLLRRRYDEPLLIKAIVVSDIIITGFRNSSARLKALIVKSKSSCTEDGARTMSS